MKLTCALAAAILAATSVQALPFQPNEALSEVIARSVIETDDATLQLTQRGTDITAVRQTDASAVKAADPVGLAKRSGVPPNNLLDQWLMKFGKAEVWDKASPEEKAMLLELVYPNRAAANERLKKNQQSYSYGGKGSGSGSGSVSVDDVAQQGGDLLAKFWKLPEDERNKLLEASVSNRAKINEKLKDIQEKESLAKEKRKKEKKGSYFD